MSNHSFTLMPNDTLHPMHGTSTAEVDYISHAAIYIVMGILSFLSVIGTAGNALVLYVFAKKRDRLTSTLFILSLAFVDFITCLIVIPYTIYMEYVDFHVKYDVSCKVYQFLITSNIPFSALIMVAIAIDRYFCICHPFLHAMNMFRAKLIVVFLAIVATALGVMVAMMYGVYKSMPSVGHTTPIPPNMTDFYPSNDTSSGMGSTYTVDQAREMMFSPLNSPSNLTDEPIHVIVVYTGSCDTNTFMLSDKFQWWYQKLYCALFLICLVIVVILYVLIYQSVLARRTKRQKQKSHMLPLMVTTTHDNNGNGHAEETLLTTVNGENGETTAACPETEGKNTLQVEKSTGNKLPENTNNIERKPSKNNISKQKDKARRKSAKKDKNRVANYKTAAMLFVVTVVFIVTFLPSFLMALGLITYNVIVFYLYFANNVANPVIYSFMNKNFRDDLRKLFCGRY